SDLHCHWRTDLTSKDLPCFQQEGVLKSPSQIYSMLDTKQFLNRDDIGIILINQYIAEMVRHALDAHQRSIPAVLEIPSKEHPYDAAKDSILRRAKGMFTAEDLR
ncbi:mCG9139, isoform CRA_a, partial [Mus musculus]